MRQPEPLATRRHYALARAFAWPPFVTSPTRPENNITRQIIIAISLLALAVVMWRVADVLVVGFGGVVFAAMLRALALPLARKTGWHERWAVLAVVLTIVIGGLGWLFGQQATDQATELKQQLPAAAHKLVGVIERTDVGKAVVSTVRDSMADSKTLSNVGVAATAIVAGVANILLVLFLGVYFAVDPRLYRAGALRLLPPHHRGRVGRALDDAGEALQKWLVGQAIAMVTVGVLVGVGLAIAGVPLAFALGVLAALLEFVPVVGPILFSIPGLLLAFSKGPHVAFYALIVYVVVQQLEGNVLIPIIQRWAVRLPPVLGLLAVVAGGLLLGMTGVVFATPLAVVLMRLVQHLYVEEALENGSGPPAQKVRAAA
jgi:predicted PurR-regulated permease PerM